MANIDVGGAGGGKKAVDANIPLIPFIDLLLCCVMFLLVTAVWNQLASRDVSQRVPGEAQAIELDDDDLKLIVQLTAAGYLVSTTAGDSIPIPKQGDAYDVETLATRLGDYRARLPNQKALTFAPDDGVRYEHIIEAMDVAAGVGYEGMSLSGT